MPGTLISGQTFTLRVKEVQQNADRFPSSGTGETTYCHYITLADELGEEFPSQLCGPLPTMNHCAKGDTVKVIMKSQTRGRYNIETITVQPKTPQPVKQPLSANYSQNKPIDQVPEIANPNVAGKAATIALQSSVSYFQNRAPLNPENPHVPILALADHFYTFLTSKG